MTRTNTIHHVPGQHLTFQDREQIAIAYNRNLQQSADKRLSLRKQAAQLGLPYSTLRREIRRGPVRGALPKPDNLSIEDRPDLSARAEFGHWEMEPIVSSVHGKGGLLVLIERHIRFYLLAKIRRINQMEVLRALRSLIRSGQMRKILSITTDNGCKFLDARHIEALFSRINAPLKVYSAASRPTPS